PDRRGALTSRASARLAAAGRPRGHCMWRAPPIGAAMPTTASLVPRCILEEDDVAAEPGVGGETRRRGPVAALDEADLERCGHAVQPGKIGLVAADGPAA